MADTRITLRENIYSGGTLAAAEGSELTPEQAYRLGVTDDGEFDRTLSTDDLLKRSGGAPVVVTDNDLADATAEQVIAHLKSDPGSVDRIAAMEEAREHPRSTVLAAIERAQSE